MNSLLRATLLLLFTVWVGSPSALGQIKISQLPALGAAPAANDLIPIVDVSVSATKTITIDNLSLAVTPAFAQLTSKPTTLNGYGITDAQPLNSGLTSLGNAATTNKFYYLSAANTWSAVTIGSNLTFSAGTLSATAPDLTAPGPIGSVTPSTGAFTTLSASGALTLGGNAILNGDAANVLGLRNGATGQALRVYNTYTDASNNEYGGIQWSGANFCYIGTEKNGTGTQRQTILIGSSLLFNTGTIASGNTRWQMNVAGHFLANADNTYGIGGATLAATGNRPLFINVGTSGLAFDRTNTAGGTTGAQTINKSSGSVNFAAAASSLVVTNSLVSATSNVIATVQTNDGTLKSVQAVPGSGSFTLFGNAAATAETRVAFLVTN